MSTLLREALLAASGAGLGVYALVDPSLLDEPARRFASRPSNALGSSVVSVVPNGIGLNDENALSVLPYVVHLAVPKLRESLLNRTIEWALESHAATWIASAVEPTRLADMLARRMEAQLSQQHPVLLRYPDARVLPIVHHVLSEEQRTVFFSPATHWWYFDREETLCTLPISPAAQPVEWSTPWQLDDDQETALMDAAAPDTVLAILRRLAPLDLERLPRGVRRGFVARQIASARRWSISAENQQALFCLAAIELGEGFDEQGDWPNALAQVKAGDWRIEDAIASTQAKGSTA